MNRSNISPSASDNIDTPIMLESSFRSIIKSTENPAGRYTCDKGVSMSRQKSDEWSSSILSRRSRIAPSRRSRIGDKSPSTLIAAIRLVSRDHGPTGSLEAPSYIGGGSVMRSTTWNAHGPEDACLSLMLMDKRLALRWCAICHRTADARARCCSLCPYPCILLFEMDAAARLSTLCSLMFRCVLGKRRVRGWRESL